jgi:hypothetical protein
VFERLQKGDMVLPAVYLDDEEVSLGHVDYFSISKAVEKARKAAAANLAPKTED